LLQHLNKTPGIPRLRVTSKCKCFVFVVKNVNWVVNNLIQLQESWMRTNSHFTSKIVHISSIYFNLKGPEGLHATGRWRLLRWRPSHQAQRGNSRVRHLQGQVQVNFWDNFSVPIIIFCFSFDYLSLESRPVVLNFESMAAHQRLIQTFWHPTIHNLDIFWYL